MKIVLGLFIIFFAFTSICSGDDNALQPLDKRTRCIVLFRECLLDIADKDAEALFQNIADGGGRNSVRIHKNLKTLSADMKRELKNNDKFFKHNFPKSLDISKSFNKILFSSLKTEKTSIAIKDSKQVGKRHIISIKVPEIDDRRFTELKFIEVGDELYWIPFGW